MCCGGVFRLGAIPDGVHTSTPEPDPPILDPIESYQFLQSLYSVPRSVEANPSVPHPHPLTDIDMYNTSSLRVVPCRSERLAKRGIKKRWVN